VSLPLQEYHGFLTFTSAASPQLCAPKHRRQHKIRANVHAKETLSWDSLFKLHIQRGKLSALRAKVTLLCLQVLDGNSDSFKKSLAGIYEPALDNLARITKSQWLISCQASFAQRQIIHQSSSHDFFFIDIFTIHPWYSVYLTITTKMQIIFTGPFTD